jgi:hypothetical protein
LASASAICEPRKPFPPSTKQFAIRSSESFINPVYYSSSYLFSSAKTVGRELMLL